MKPGDLRQFKPDLDFGPRVHRLSGQAFVLLEVELHADWVSFLVDGRVERGWGYEFVAGYSRALEPVQPTQEMVY